MNYQEIIDVEGGTDWECKNWADRELAVMVCKALVFLLCSIMISFLSMS